MWVFAVVKLFGWTTREMSSNRVIGVALVVLLGALTYFQSAFTPVERFERPKTELSKASDLTFRIPVDLAYSWSVNDVSGMSVLRNVGPTMEMVRTSGSPLTVQVLADVLLDKWENLDPKNSRVNLVLTGSQLVVAVSREVFPAKLVDDTTLVFGVVEPIDSSFYSLRDAPAVLEVIVRVGPCEVGESRLNCRFVDFSGGDFARNDWRNADLRLAQFDGSDLDSARFDGADLSGAIFIGANTNGASFEGSNLFGAIFE